MATQRTLAMIKPDAVQRGVIGEALRVAEEAGLTPIAIKRVRLTLEQARGFYAVHEGKPFFDDLTRFMSSGPAVLIVFEGDDAIAAWRRLLGATNPAEADEGTLRRRFGTDIGRNGFHGSDAPDTAAYEIGYLFSALEIHP